MIHEYDHHVGVVSFTADQEKIKFLLSREGFTSGGDDPPLKVIGIMM